tara:strand:+ start:788 stop:1129 length:342 start_codon:yes stop_codon:yes gene_type:complete
MIEKEITLEDFKKLDIRVGRILRIEDFPEARKPAYKFEVDCGPLGVKRSSAQITDGYAIEELVSRRVLCVVNLLPLRIAGFKSEVLILGACPENKPVNLLKLDKDLPPGTRVS